MGREGNLIIVFRHAIKKVLDKLPQEKDGKTVFMVGLRYPFAEKYTMQHQGVLLKMIYYCHLPQNAPRRKVQYRILGKTLLFRFHLMHCI